jgi:hypothetical protein
VPPEATEPLLPVPVLRLLCVLWLVLE